MRNLTELDRKKRFADSEECKKLKIYGDFSLLLGSHKDAVEYFSRIENTFQVCEKKDSKWLAGGMECLVAVQYLILKNKLNFNPDKYSAEKRDSAYNKISRALKIYGNERHDFNKAASCFSKFSHFFRKMNMNNYFFRMLGENMSILGHQSTSIIHKVNCADHAAHFGAYRTAAYLLFDAYEKYGNNIGLLMGGGNTVLQRSEIVLMMIQVLGICKKKGYLEDLAPSNALKPLVNRPIIHFVLTALHSANLATDKRYSLSLIFLMTMMASDKEKEKIWDALTSSSPNLDGEVVSHPLDLPYFSYMVCNPNPRKILQRKRAVVPENKEESLFLYDPRKKAQSTNWCALTSEEVTVYLYNPLPFAVVVDAVELVTKNIRVECHSGKAILKPYEQKRKVGVQVKFLEEGELEIVGVSIMVKKLYYSLTVSPNGVSNITIDNPELISSVDFLHPR